MRTNDTNVADMAMKLATGQIPKALIKRPTTGIYYGVAFPDGWRLFPYRYDQFPMIDHVDLWATHICPALSRAWAAVLKIPKQVLSAELEEYTYGFPRGRIGQDVKYRYLVLNGNDVEDYMSVSRQDIVRAFSLPKNAVWEDDEHEHCQYDEKEAVRNLFRIKKDWKAV